MNLPFRRLGYSDLYELEVVGPNGYFQEVSGSGGVEEPYTTVGYDHRRGGLSSLLQNEGADQLRLKISSNAYEQPDEDFFEIAPGKKSRKNWDLAGSGNWYDFSVESDKGYHHR